MHIKFGKHLVNLSQNHFIRLDEEDNEIAFFGPNSRNSVYFLFRNYSQDDDINKGLAKKVYDLICNFTLMNNVDFIDVDWYLEHNKVNRLID